MKSIMNLLWATVIVALVACLGALHYGVISGSASLLVGIVAAIAAIALVIHKQETLSNFARWFWARIRVNPLGMSVVGMLAMVLLVNLGALSDATIRTSTRGLFDTNTAPPSATYVSNLTVKGGITIGASSALSSNVLVLVPGGTTSTLYIVKGVITNAAAN